MTPTISTTTLLKHFSYVGVVFVALPPESYGILAFFMILDTVTGIIRAGIIRGWRSITSHLASVGILAKCLLILVPLLVAVAGHGVGLNLDIIARGALNILILSELYSILSNIQSIKQRKEVKEFDAVNYLLGTLRDWLEKNVKKQIK